MLVEHAFLAYAFAGRRSRELTAVHDTRGGSRFAARTARGSSGSATEAVRRARLRYSQRTFSNIRKSYALTVAPATFSNWVTRLFITALIVRSVNVAPLSHNVKPIA